MAMQSIIRTDTKYNRMCPWDFEVPKTSKRISCFHTSNVFFINEKEKSRSAVLSSLSI